ncbi:MAG: ATP-binding protein [Rhodocyclaceae bacterium]|nr:ATP-binding protein [Rhodocyclaceae bacterium]
MSARAPASLAQQHARLLVAVFILFELLVATAVLGFLMVPMARRSASDLAGLMVLSAQTWSELPPVTRPAFEQELATTHLLALRAAPPLHDRDEWHGPYLYFLEAALAERTGQPRHLSREWIGEEEWFWTALPSGTGHISVGFPIRRVDVQPLAALFLSTLAGMALAVLAACWLAARTNAPLARLASAVARLGRGETPQLLDESGPRELATLACRFNAMARQVQELLAARTILLAGLSHDLRTPLARMRLALTLLEERPSPKTLQRLEQDVEEMDRLIGNVLSLARGLHGEGAKELALQPLLAELAAHAPPGRVAVNCPPIQVHAAPQGLRRALANLLENALRYGGDGPVELVASRQAGTVRIGVLDQGPGIPADQLEAVFQPFHRLEASRSPRTGGAGLGLAIVAQLAQANGWEVKLQPRPGGGLMAWLEWPEPGAGVVPAQPV